MIKKFLISILFNIVKANNKNLKKFKLIEVLMEKNKLYYFCKYI